MANTATGVEASAIQVLKRAVELDTARRFDEAVVCYQEGLQLLIQVLKVTTDANKKEAMRQKVRDYMGRAEQLKLHVNEVKDAVKSHEQIQVEANSTGHGYESIFSKYLNTFLSEVEIDDPYIRSTHQIYNLLRFCEMVVKSKSPVNLIKLKTSCDEDANNKSQQMNRIQQLTKSLLEHNIKLEVQYSDTLHDREIRFNNGWIVKIGRGLDMYKATDSKFSVGFCDFDLRQCHQTTVDIFHSNYLHQQKSDNNT